MWPLTAVQSTHITVDQMFSNLAKERFWSTISTMVHLPQKGGKNLNHKGLISPVVDFVDVVLNAVCLKGSISCSM